MTTPNNEGAAFPREDVFVDERGLTVRAPRKPVSAAAGGGVDVLAVMDNFIDPDRYPHQPHDLTEARAAVEAMAVALVKAHSLFQQINLDDDGEDHLDLSRDGILLLKPLLAAFGSAAWVEYVRESKRAARTAIAELLAAGNFMATNPNGTLTPGALERWRRAAAPFSEES